MRRRCRVLGLEGRRYNLWCSGKSHGLGGVGVMLMEKLREKVVEVRRVSDRMMAVVLVFEKDALKLILVHASQSGGCLERKLYTV